VFIVEETDDDPKRLHIRGWRAKAEELRSIAYGMKNDHARQKMLNAAANYERLADEAEKRYKPVASRSRPEAC
jgi:hypothetical protein